MITDTDTDCGYKSTVVAMLAGLDFGFDDEGYMMAGDYRIGYGPSYHDEFIHIDEIVCAFIDNKEE